MTTDKPSAGELADAIEAKLKHPCGEYIISALEGSIIVPALRRPPVAGAEVGVRDYTAWLIEVDDDEGPIYFQLVDDDNWSSDQNAALHFARKQDAEKYIADVGWTRAKAVEHMWPLSPPVAERGGGE